ncbi:unnamed protein product [Paramecium sonneborni]|uniref:Uncharacterized protein n=1 Tax=Paramecium sonneborni TaxID=65129 RepID=A0A8S1RPW0_9CILI|nr:unnamed protein product [Paramecium sonneborni]
MRLKRQKFIAKDIFRIFQVDILRQEINFMNKARQRAGFWYQSKNNQCALKFVEKFIKNAKTNGLSLEYPFYLPVESTNGKDWVFYIIWQAIQQFLQSIKNMIYRFIKNKNNFSQQKRKEGVSHQNITLQLIEKQNFRKIISKIVQQIHSKLGNKIWNIQKIKEISVDIMVIGIDVYHKTRQELILALDSMLNLVNKVMVTLQSL